MLAHVCYTKAIFSEPNGKKVVCGDWKLNTTDTYEQALPITQIIRHPNFDAISLQNDIAVVKVLGSFSCLQQKIYPACVPNEEVSLLYKPSLILKFYYI